MDSDSSDAFEELLHFNRIVFSFQQYENDNKSITLKSLYDFEHLLPSNHTKLLKNAFKLKTDRILSCLSVNQNLFKIIVETVSKNFLVSLKQDVLQSKRELTTEDNKNNTYISELNKDKVRSILLQLTRDWSEYGATERNCTYRPIIDLLDKKIFSNINYSQRNKIKILIPGSGLSRLVYELARLGFYCEGNEVSYHMILTSFLILNCSEKKHQFQICPYVHNTINSLNSENLFRAIHVPDVDFHKNNNKELLLSMVAGEFETVYNDPSYFNSFSVIITCFFLDTAHNVISYIELISKLLKPDGYWIHFGPLLYHFHNVFNEISLELSWDEIKSTFSAFNLKLISEETDKIAYYTNDPLSMLQHNYHCVFSLLQKT